MVEWGITLASIAETAFEDVLRKLRGNDEDIYKRLERFIELTKKKEIDVAGY